MRQKNEQAIQRALKKADQLKLQKSPKLSNKPSIAALQGGYSPYANNYQRDRQSVEELLSDYDRPSRRVVAVS